MKILLHRSACGGMVRASLVAGILLAVTGRAAAQAPAATGESSAVPRAVSWQEINGRWSGQPLDATRKAAEAGEVTAQHYLGRYFGDGLGGTTNWDEAFKWYRRAADRGFANSQNNLGVAYLNGRGGNPDRKEAERWFRLAGATGQLQLADVLVGDPAPERKAEGRTLLEQAARGGDAAAMARLGRLLSGGVYDEQANALYWLKKAFRAGVTNVCSNIGWIYVEGRFHWVSARDNTLQTDYDSAVDWFRRGMETGDSYCELSLGWLHLEGHGVIQSYDEGFKLIQQAAEKGNPAALRNLGRLYAHDQVPLAASGPPDLVKAAGYYHRAMEAGDADAVPRLARLLARGKAALPDVDAETVVRRAMEGKHREAFVWLAQLIEAGRAKARNDEEAPLQLYYRAAAEFDSEAVETLSRRYQTGAGVPQDLLVAAHYESVLVRLTMGGRGAVRDERLAASIARYLAAVQAKDITAAMEIGNRYRGGRDAYQSDFEAYIWYSHAARNGDVAAVAAKEKAGAKLKPAELTRADQRIRQMKYTAVQWTP